MGDAHLLIPIATLVLGGTSLSGGNRTNFTRKYPQLTGGLKMLII